MRVHVDLDRCEANGLGVMAGPEVFALDDAGQLHNEAEPDQELSSMPKTPAAAAVLAITITRARPTGSCDQMTAATIKTVDNGFLQVKGPVQLVDHDDISYDVGRTAFLCRCGGSATSPSATAHTQRCGLRRQSAPPPLRTEAKATRSD